MLHFTPPHLTRFFLSLDDELNGVGVGGHSLTELTTGRVVDVPVLALEREGSYYKLKELACAHGRHGFMPSSRLNNIGEAYNDQVAKWAARTIGIGRACTKSDRCIDLYNRWRISYWKSMTESDSTPRSRAGITKKLAVRQESSIGSSISSSETPALAQDTLATSGNPIVSTDSSSPSTILSLANSLVASDSAGSTPTQVTGTDLTSVAVTASQSSDAATGVASDVTSDSSTTPTDAPTSGQTTVPTGGATSEGATSGVTDSTSGDTSSPSGPSTGTGGSGTLSATSATSTAATTSSTDPSSSSSDVPSTASIPLSTISTTASEISTPASSSSVRPTQNLSSDTGTSSMATTTQQQASTSFTTSFSEIITTENGAVTTIYSPVPTLNTDTTSVASDSRRSAIIAGGAVGGAAVILLCIAIVFCCQRHQKRKVELAHRQLPTPRSMLLAGEDDFDLAGPSTRPSGIRRGLGILGSLARGGRSTHARGDSTNSVTHLNVGTCYSDVEDGNTQGMSSYGAPHVSLAALSADTPENRALDGAPPRLLRPRISGSGSLFEEQVWPPPREGLRDPLMAASSVDLTSIADDVMGPSHDGESLATGSIYTGPGSTTEVAKSARIRGGDVAASENESLLVEPDGESGTLNRENRESISTRGGGHTPDATWHQRDWSVGSQAPLLGHRDGASSPPSSYPYRQQRNSSGSGSWLPPGAARAIVPGVDSSYSLGGGSQSIVNLPPAASRSSFQAPTMQPTASGSSANPQSKLWIDRIPRRSIDSKATSEMQARRLSVSNPDDVPVSPSSTAEEAFPPPPPPKENKPPERADTGQTLASSFSLSTSSTQRLQNLQGGDMYAQPAFPDMSEVDPQSPARSLSLGHSLPASTSVRLIDVDELPEHEVQHSEPVSPPEVLDEIPPRYDMIRRDTELAEIQRSIHMNSDHEGVGTAL